jgi:hypothetical protein
LEKEPHIAEDPVEESRRIMACLEIGKLLTSTHNLDEILELIMNKAHQSIDSPYS